MGSNSFNTISHLMFVNDILVFLMGLLHWLKLLGQFLILIVLLVVKLLIIISVALTVVSILFALESELLSFGWSFLILAFLFPSWVFLFSKSWWSVFILLIWLIALPIGSIIGSLNYFPLLVNLLLSIILSSIPLHYMACINIPN